MKRTVPSVAQRSAARDTALPASANTTIAILSDDAARILSAAAVLQKQGTRFRFIEVPSDLEEVARACHDRIEVVLVEDPLPHAHIHDLLRTTPPTTRDSGLRTVVLMDGADKALREDARKAGATLVAETPRNSPPLQNLLRPRTPPTSPPPEPPASPPLALHARELCEFGTLISGIFEIRTLEEAESLAALLANNTPEPEKVRIGIWELLSNAIEHGNLGISFEEKTHLLETGHFHEEITRRLTLDRYRDRVARVSFSLRSDRAHLQVSDDGPGFDFHEFLNSELQVERPNGRGIRLVCRMCFDELAYAGTGNTVEATVYFRDQAREESGEDEETG